MLAIKKCLSRRSAASVASFTSWTAPSTVDPSLRYLHSISSQSMLACHKNNKNNKHNITSNTILSPSLSLCTKVVNFSTSSTIPTHDPQNLQPKPPTKLTLDMIEGIQSANMLILRHGVGKQRLELLAKDSMTANNLVLKWQRMMEIYLGSQLHVLVSLGYPANEQGIMQYTQQLSTFMNEMNDVDLQEEFRAQGRVVWREMLQTTFELDPEIANEEELSIVDARNIAHKVSSKLVEPEILATVEEQCGKINESNTEVEVGKKHSVIQNVVVNEVYVNSGLVEECGFGTGAQGYARMQYRMAYHEADPLCVQYTTSSMLKLWQAAGLDLSHQPNATKIPMSVPPPH